MGLYPPRRLSGVMSSGAAEEIAKLKSIAEIGGSWLRHLVARKAKHLQHDSSAFLSGHEQADREEVTDLGEADLLTSRFQGEGIETHALLLDLDVEHTYFPSTTEGHGHLLVNVKLSRSEWLVVMDVLSKAGVIESGYKQASATRGYASLRLPWIKKELA